jgi:hypothetical protein
MRGLVVISGKAGASTEAPGSQIFAGFRASQNELHISGICRLTSKTARPKHRAPRRGGLLKGAGPERESQPAFRVHRRFIKSAPNGFSEENSIGSDALHKP